MSDSGGIQEEASTIGKPVIILRESTERPEVLESGYGFLKEDNSIKITDIFRKLHAIDNGYEDLARMPKPFGDGRASERILDFLRLEEVRAFIENYPATAEDILDYKAKVQPWRQV